MKSKFKDILGSCFLIRLPRMEDAEDMFYNWASDDEVTAELPWYSHESVEVSKMIMEMWIHHESTTFNWIMESLQTKQAIGTLSMYLVPRQSKTVGIGFCLSRAYWNKGIMTEAVSLMLNYAFSRGYRKVIAYHKDKNIASQRVLEKNGFVQDKIKLVKDVKDGLDTTLVYYKLTSKDFKERGLKQ